jgi:sodium transport system permease protein
MQWSNIKLIFLREMRDQLRDRRTLFLIAVLPLLLYPLLGMSFFQLSQFLRDHAAKVLVLGTGELENIEWLPRLLDEKHFDANLFDSPREHDNLQVVWPSEIDQATVSRGVHDGQDSQDSGNERAGHDILTAPDWEQAARALVDAGTVDVVVRFPEGFGEGLRRSRKAVVERQTEGGVKLPEPILLFNSANERSQITQMRVEQVLRQWRGRVTQQNLADSNVPADVTEPFTLRPRDVAEVRQRQAAIWSKILPFVVFIWALTGAFYPAVDLCAGEKERGTLETLLTSPALRREIVWGKLLTIMLFSSTTAVLNLASLGFTGKFVIAQLSEVTTLSDRMPLSMPPMASLGWLVVALIPISALFSALCLACAAFARSTKEGQYYLMPLMLIVMPLMLLPMSPGVELNLGNSLIPVTGMVLLLRALIEGQYLSAVQYIVPTVGVTLICCLLAIRWAEEQFNSESVLFRESERLQLGRWFAHLVRDRSETPSLAQAVLCVAIILVVQFFISISLSTQGMKELTFSFLAQSLFISQIVCILVPAMMMTLVLTRSPTRTLLLDRLPRVTHLAAAALLAVLLHPLVVRMGEAIQEIYPMSPEVAASAQEIQATLGEAPSWWMALGLIAVLPAFCEELAFRGFVLSGLRHLGHKWWAIGLSAIAFGGVHMFLQQRISASAVGLVLGYLAVQTGSLIPCMLFHALHNGLQLTVFRIGSHLETTPDVALTGFDSLLAKLVQGEHPLWYRPGSLILCGVGAALILWGLHYVTYSRSKEEMLQEARDRQAGHLAGA